MKASISSSSSSVASKGCASAFFSIFAIAGLVFLGFIVKAGWDTVRAYTWTKTDCMIEASSVREKGDSVEFDVRYTYRIGGRNYTGTRYSAGMSPSMNAASAQRAVQRYAAGKPAYCYVNESAPAESTLERGTPLMLLFGLIPLVFVAVGVGGIIGVWRTKPASATPVSERFREGKGTMIGMRLFGFVFIALGGGLLYAIFFRPMLKEFAAAKWPVVPCEITSSKVGWHSGSKSSTYSVDVRYRYVIGGKEFIGTAYNFDTGTSSSRGWRETAVASLPAGMRTVCHVNPEDPLDAVLSVKGSPDRWFGLIPGLFLIVGLIIFFKAPSMGRTGSASPVGLTITSSHAGLPTLVHPGTTGEVELKQATPPGCAFAALTVFALIWNGFVWFMVAKMKGEGWGPHLFIGIFVLAGLAMAGAAFYQFLALFNPRPILTVSAPAVPLGGSLDVRWRFTGNARRLARLTVSLMAREEATYRRGTTTSTDKSVFLNTVLIDTADHAQMPGGSVKAAIPRDLIHTFTAKNNKVIWMLRVHGDIPKWPDVDAEFPITVLPREAATLFHEQPPDT
ncbi:MAG: DUF3592 domain-containing protein [Chthoniobacteraceae bacterium]